MTLPVSGPISMSQINVELSRPATQTVSLDEAPVRGLAGIVSGPIGFSNLLGKAAWAPSLFPAGDGAFGTLSFKNFTIECNGAPEGATYAWSISPVSGAWSVQSGQGTDTVIVRVTGVVDSDSEAQVTCTVTHSGVSKSVSGTWEYSSYSNP